MERIAWGKNRLDPCRTERHYQLSVSNKCDSTYSLWLNFQILHNELQCGELSSQSFLTHAMFIPKKVKKIDENHFKKDNLRGADWLNLKIGSGAKNFFGC